MPKTRTFKVATTAHGDVEFDASRPLWRMKLAKKLRGRDPTDPQAVAALAAASLLQLGSERFSEPDGVERLERVALQLQDEELEEFAGAYLSADEAFGSLADEDPKATPVALLAHAVKAEWDNIEVGTRKALAPMQALLGKQRQLYENLFGSSIAKVAAQAAETSSQFEGLRRSAERLSELGGGMARPLAIARPPPSVGKSVAEALFAARAAEADERSRHVQASVDAADGIARVERLIQALAEHSAQTARVAEAQKKETEAQNELHGQAFDFLRKQAASANRGARLSLAIATVSVVVAVAFGIITFRTDRGRSADAQLAVDTARQEFRASSEATTLALQALSAVLQDGLRSIALAAAQGGPSADPDSATRTGGAAKSRGNEQRDRRGPDR